MDRNATRPFSISNVKEEAPYRLDSTYLDEIARTGNKALRNIKKMKRNSRMRHALTSDMVAKDSKSRVVSANELDHGSGGDDSKSRRRIKGEEKRRQHLESTSYHLFNNN